MKKARLNGCRKKRADINLGLDVLDDLFLTQPVPPVIDAPVQSKPVLDVLFLTEPVPPMIDALVQSEPVLDVPPIEHDVQTEPVPHIELVVQTEPDLSVAVQTEHDLAVVVQTEQDPDVEEVQQVKEVLGRAVGKPTGRGKKTKSINKLCAAEVDKDKISSGKKEKKLSRKKRPKK